MLTDIFRGMVNNTFKENFYEKRKKKKEKKKLCLVTFFVFYFQKLVFRNIKKKQFSCIFKIKNMFGQLKLKRQFFEEKNRKH